MAGRNNLYKARIWTDMKAFVGITLMLSSENWSQIFLKSVTMAVSSTAVSTWFKWFATQQIWFVNMTSEIWIQNIMRRFIRQPSITTSNLAEETWILQYDFWGWGKERVPGNLGEETWTQQYHFRPSSRPAVVEIPGGCQIFKKKSRNISISLKHLGIKFGVDLRRCHALN